MTVLDLMTMLAQCPLSAEVYTYSASNKSGDFVVAYDECMDQASVVRPIVKVKYVARGRSVREMAP